MPLRKGEAMTSKKASSVSRRKFLTNVATGGAAIAIVPRHVLGRGYTPPSDLLNIAGVGIGGMGRTNLINLASQNIVALCDVDWGYANKGFDHLDTEIPTLQTRLDQPNSLPTPGQPPVEFDRVKAKVRLDGMIRLKNEHLPKAKRYQDYREMLEKQKDIDAVLARLRARGAELVGELGRYEDRYRLCYVRGPEGIIVELAEQIA